MCVTCAWFRQQNREIVSTKSSKTTIRENLDHRKFNAIRYTHSTHTDIHEACHMQTLFGKDKAPSVQGG